jgi:16S rRNA U516 pseudouridylate synthase RsuA-like enzyme
MHRLSRSDLESRLFVAFVTASKLIHRKLLSKQRMVVEEGRKEMIRHLCDKIDNDSSMVIRTEFTGEPPKTPGKWGVDEPSPV